MNESLNGCVEMEDQVRNRRRSLSQTRRPRPRSSSPHQIKSLHAQATETAKEAARGASKALQHKEQEASADLKRVLESGFAEVKNVLQKYTKA